MDDAASRPVRAGPLDRVRLLAERLSLGAASGCVIAMLALNVANLALRNLTGRGIVWVWAWTGVLFVWSVFFAFHVLYRQHQDVAVDLVVERVSAAWRRALGVLVCVCGLLFTGVVLLQAPAIVKRQVGVMDFVGLDRYWLSLPLVWASFFLFVEFLITLRRPEAQFERADAAEVPKWSL